MSILYPNVPLAIAGIPAVLRRAQTLADATETIARAERDVSNSIAAQRWGIFNLDGTPALEGDAFVSFEHTAEYRIADYPLAGGSFESYDKVATPFDARVMVSKGGTVAERETFLTACQRLIESFETYNIATPERTYLNVNVTRIGMTRNATAGAGMTSVELVLREVRQAAKAAFSKTEVSSDIPPIATDTTPAAAPPVSAAPKTTRRPAAVRKVNQGSVQPRQVKPVAQIETTRSGRKIYVYDRPPGT